MILRVIYVWKGIPVTCDMICALTIYISASDLSGFLQKLVDNHLTIIVLGSVRQD